MDPLDAFPPIPSGPTPQSPTARVERADADHQRERTRDDERSSSEDEQSFEDELEDASRHGDEPERDDAADDDGVDVSLLAYQGEPPPVAGIRPEASADAASTPAQRPLRDRRAPPPPGGAPDDGDPGAHIDISV